MGVNPDFSDLFAALNAAECRDIWIQPTQPNADRVYSALAKFGAPLDELVVEDLATPGTIFQIGVEPNRIDILTDVAGVEFNSAWDRRNKSAYGGNAIWLLDLESLKRAKRASGRPQDLLDVKLLEEVDTE